MIEDTYQALPRKYRPHTFDDMVGQVNPCRVLRASVKSGRVFACYIFRGTAGSGKTSMARVFAMAVNCSNREPQNANPCLECVSCTEILKQRNPDVLEIDGPSYGGVDSIRDLKEKAMYSPQFKRRIFIIDEAHGLSDKAFQAMLKLLEEPPPFVTFILCTTETAKIPATIHSRSIPLDFLRHTETDTADRLQVIAQGEGVVLEPEAADLIARYADGNLRDSVTVMEQLITAAKFDEDPNAAIKADQVADAFGIVSGSELESLMTAILNKDAVTLEEVLISTLSRTTEFGSITRAITDFYRDVLRTKAGSHHLIRRGESELDLLKDFSKTRTLDQIEQSLSLCWNMADRVKSSSSNPKSFFMTGLYMLMLHTDPPEGAQVHEVRVKASALPPETVRPSAFDQSQSSTPSLEEQLAALNARAAS